MIHTGDCLDVMATFDAESIDAIVTDPPYGLEFMGKEWDSFGGGVGWKPGQLSDTQNLPDGNVFKEKGFGQLPIYRGMTDRQRSQFQDFNFRWAEAAYRVAKPSAYLLAFGGTRTVHRMTVALEDAGWIIRDMLVWAYASGFPKSKASLKPAWEPIVMARKPGPLRMLAIDECRIPTSDTYAYPNGPQGTHFAVGKEPDGSRPEPVESDPRGRWPANVVLTDPIFDGGWDGVVGGGWQSGGGNPPRRLTEDRTAYGSFAQGQDTGLEPVDTEGTYSRFFLVPKSSRSDREPAIPPEWYEDGKRANSHPTCKPTELMRHLVRLVTPAGGTVLDPFLGSGTTALAAETEGFPWVGIEKEESYVEIANARLNGVQRGLGLDLGSTIQERHPIAGVDAQLFLGVAGPTEGDEVA